VHRSFEERNRAGGEELEPDDQGHGCVERDALEHPGFDRFDPRAAVSRPNQIGLSNGGSTSVMTAAPPRLRFNN
jgi:hypothetical protein